MRLPSFSSYIVHNRGLMQMFYCDITQLCVIRTSRESDHINANEEHLAITNGRKIESWFYKMQNLPEHNLPSR